VKKRIYIESSPILWTCNTAANPKEKEVQQEARNLFRHLQIFRDEYDICVSTEVIRELNHNEKSLHEFFKLKPEILSVDNDVNVLAVEYFMRGLLPENKQSDLMHLAYATKGDCDMLISNDPRHIANEEQQEKVNTINKENGYTKKIKLLTVQEAIVELYATLENKFSQKNDIENMKKLEEEVQEGEQKIKEILSETEKRRYL